MKSFPFQIFLTAAALMTPAFALEAPADNAPPPPVEKKSAADLPIIKLPADGQAQATAQADATPAKSDVAFLGVVSGELPEVLANHLDLKQGIVVRGMASGGPAQQAGLEENDVITSVGGEAVDSPIALRKVVSAHKPGEKVTLDVIHKGKPGKIDVTLGTRPEDPADAEQPNEQDLDGLPKELADRVREAMEGKLGGIDAEMADQMKMQQEKIEEMRKHMLEQLDGQRRMPQIRMQGTSTVRMSDNEGSVEVKSNNGDKQVTIRDHQDNVTWTGPWNNDEDRGKAPENIRRRVDSLNLDTTFQGNGLRLQLNRPLPDKEEDKGH